MIKTKRGHLSFCQGLCSTSVTNSRAECLLSVNGSLILSTMEMGRRVCGPRCFLHQCLGFMDSTTWTHSHLHWQESERAQTFQNCLLNCFLVYIHQALDSKLPKGTNLHEYFHTPGRPLVFFPLLRTVPPRQKKLITYNYFQLFWLIHRIHMHTCAHTHTGFRI